jgi:hypothetical protein
MAAPARAVGSGVFFGLTLLVAFPLRSAKVVGTDIFHAAALLWVAGIGHFVAGNVDLSAVGWLLIGSFPGVLIGSALVLHVPERALRLLLAAILVLSGVKLADLPGANWIAGAGIVAAVFLFAGASYRKSVLVRRARSVELAPADGRTASLRTDALNRKVHGPAPLAAVAHLSQTRMVGRFFSGRQARS